MVKKIIAEGYGKDYDHLVDSKNDYMEDDKESKLLMSAYNLMELLGYSYKEVEEISEELNDDITLVLSFLKDELISNHGPELNQEIKILMEDIKNYIMEGLKYHADKEGYKITPLPKRKN